MERFFSASGKVFAICLLVILLGGIAAASTTGWIDLKGLIAQVLPEQQEKGGQGGGKAESLAEENKRLKERLKYLEQQLQKERELRMSLEERINSTKTGSEQEAKTTGYRALGEYYSGMKPTVAAAILGRLDLAMVAEILRGMDEEDAGKILAAMEPERAAQLTEVMAEGAALEDKIQ